MRRAAMSLVLIGVFCTPGAGQAVTVDAVAAEALVSEGTAAVPLTAPLPDAAAALPAPVAPRTNALPPREPAQTGLPDTSSWALLIIGLGLAGLVARRRRDAQSVSA